MWRMRKCIKLRNRVGAWMDDNGRWWMSTMDHEVVVFSCKMKMRCRLPRLPLMASVLGLRCDACCPDGSVTKMMERCIKFVPRDVEHSFTVDLPRRRADHGEISGKAIRQPSATLRERGDIRTLQPLRPSIGLRSGEEEAGEW